MNTVSPAVIVATERAARAAQSGQVPERVRVTGASQYRDKYNWPHNTIIAVDKAIAEKPLGYYVPMYQVYCFDAEVRFGAGCDQCCNAGRIGVYTADEFEPYITEQICPNCRQT